MFQNAFAILGLILIFIVFFAKSVALGIGFAVFVIAATILTVYNTMVGNDVKEESYSFTKETK